MSSNQSDKVPEGTGPKPTDAQMRLLAIMMQNMKGKPEFDWDGIVAQAGYKNVTTAKSVYSQMRKKFGWNMGNTASTNTPSPAKPASNAIAGSSSSSSSNHLVGGAKTPTKVGKNPGKGGSSAKKPRSKKVKAELEGDGKEGNTSGVDAPIKTERGESM
ncbi:hypothetical protein M406DRAFT_68346 [Cryphonectria parasitica EP155]|uniref:Uncharacterized protein n=1 Tax=Cryphonectria parasitica (strain ATCC 38755 / EP155) TaxID=660469 RepID=A0A9P5CQE5_CRYP1|nr:uncharacterized protein M406DRAFT_68346 [Cryphonectria parasitica EP155]KAF3765965.1 hypothetical protein M406DRAFT_68346 [Cryphonectria parasitica EP155]